MQVWQPARVTLLSASGEVHPVPARRKQRIDPTILIQATVVGERRAQGPVVVVDDHDDAMVHAAGPYFPPLMRHHMPTDGAITLKKYMASTGGEWRLPDDCMNAPKQSMRGFEDAYRNIVDYIVRITFRIWDDRDVEYIRDTYGAESHTFDDFGLQFGSDKVVRDTYASMTAFSDIECVAQEVIWAGDDEVGFHTSHRVLIRGTNDGPSKYGPATGKKVEFVVIANCVAKNNIISLEHVLYNAPALIEQLGFDIHDQLQKMQSEPPQGWPLPEALWNQMRNAVKPPQPISEADPVAGFDVDRLVRGAFGETWGARRSPDRLRAYYTDDVSVVSASNRKWTGLEKHCEFFDMLTQAFPDLCVQVDEVYWANEGAETHVALRWSATATHAAAGLYGAPTHSKVRLWGLNQYDVVGERIAREWMLFNEFDILLQLRTANSGLMH
jgi:predicted ester cyclase